MARLDDFSADVVRSGLVSAEEVDRARAQIRIENPQEAAVALARSLIASGHLTNYQAKKVLAGSTKGFFLGGHRILRRLGAGGMGKVYLAVDSDGFKVAIKVLPPKLAAEGGQALRRFRREMDLSQRVRHPNIARTIDVGEEDGVYFMIMEYVPGDSLYNIVKKSGPWRVLDVARYFTLVCDGLEAAHQGGLIHRDVKPSNLMITPEGDAKILDLGLARASDEESNLTKDRTLVGTLDYASPEQLADAKKADARSDLYSLGCTFYFTLAGRAPFEGGTVVNKIYMQRMEEPPPLEKITRGVPAAFAAIVRKLMAKNPNDRYQTALELKADLERWTDPKVVKSILGAEADDVRAFRPPPPDLEDEDLRFSLADTKETPSTASALRDLGDDEPEPAPTITPRRIVAEVARPAIVLPDPNPSDQAGVFESTPWLMPFIAIVCVLGALAIVLIWALGR